jgi:hypothetical protein
MSLSILRFSKDTATNFGTLRVKVVDALIEARRL